MYRPVKNHLSNTFRNEKDMYTYWNITKSAYKYHKNAGWNIKDILTTPLKQAEPNIVTDHLGNKYGSIKEMCRHYNINISTYRTRLRMGWSLEAILTTGNMRPENKVIPIKDHLGNEFRSKAEMCDHYGVQKHTFLNRIKNGNDLETALTKSVTDTLGHQFESREDMYNLYRMHRTTFKRRIQKGWSTADALLIGEKDEHLTVKSRINNNVYLVEHDGHETLWSSEEIYVYLKNHNRKVR